MILTAITHQPHSNRIFSLLATCQPQRLCHTVSSAHLRAGASMLTRADSASRHIGPQSLEDHPRMHELRRVAMVCSLHLAPILTADRVSGSSNWQSWVLDEEKGIKHIKAAYVSAALPTARFAECAWDSYDAGIQTFDTA